MSGTKRISALTELASGSVDEDDILAIVDMSQASVTDKTKHVKVKNLIAVGGRLEIDSFAELATKFVGSSPSSTQQIAATNDIVVWREKGFRYQCVTSGEHFDYTGSGGLKWKVLPHDVGYVTPQQFGFVENSTDDQSSTIQSAVTNFSWVHFPPMTSGYYYMGSSDLVLASTASPRNDVKLTGGFKGNSGPRTSEILFAAGYGLKVSGTSGAYCLYRLETRDLFFGPVSSDSRSTPIFQFTGVAYWDRSNCHFQGDTLKEQPVLKGRWSLGITSRHCNIWGGLTGEDYGTASDPLNGIDCLGDNHNGSRYAGKYSTTSFKKYGGFVQSCGDGFMIGESGGDSSSGVVIDGVYFENNKYHDGANFTGRDITLGASLYVRNIRIENCYFAQLTADNAFTSGQGKSTIPFIQVDRVQGCKIENNFWTSGGATSLVELCHTNTGGVIFPNNISIKNNTDLYTDQQASVDWKSTVIESQKFAVFSNDLCQIQDWTEKLIGVTKTVRSPDIVVSGAGTQYVSIMNSNHYGKVVAARLICSDTINITATVDVGVSASNTFYVNGASVGSKTRYTTTTLTLNNTRIATSNGPILAKVVTSAVTTAGSFSIELDYCDVLE